MVSKKVLGPALTGTGAVGASGALAWTLGLLEEEILDDVVEGKKETLDSAKQPKPPQENQNVQKADKPSANSSASKKPTAPSTPLQGPSSSPVSGYKVIVTSQVITGSEATRQYFTRGAATNEDKEVIKETLTWKIVWNGGFESIQIKAGGTENAPLWDCRLRHTSIKKIKSDNDSNSELMRQGSDLIKAIENDSAHKERFVENCSKSREKVNGSVKTEGFIELETEEVGGKVRFKESNGYFQRLWTQDFAGVDKLSEEDEKLLDLMENKWNVEEIKEEEGKTGKIKISAQGKEWNCHISGNYGSDLKGKTFKKNDELRKVLKADKYSYANEKEWKKYLIRNCRKNGMNIEGLKIKVTGSDWWFDDASVKKISEGMYTNPTGVKA